eukprot:9471245-Pyramimonas_sp.AAC.2
MPLPATRPAPVALLGDAILTRTDMPATCGGHRSIQTLIGRPIAGANLPPGYLKPAHGVSVAAAGTRHEPRHRAGHNRRRRSTPRRFPPWIPGRVLPRSAIRHSQRLIAVRHGLNRPGRARARARTTTHDNAEPGRGLRATPVDTLRVSSNRRHRDRGKRTRVPCIEPQERADAERSGVAQRPGLTPSIVRLKRLHGWRREHAH